MLPCFFVYCFFVFKIIIIVSINSKRKQPLNSYELRCTSLVSCTVSVQDSAKGSVNVASSVQTSFQSLKIYSAKVL